MATIWFMLVAVLIAGYVLLDGFDLGVGIVHRLVGKTERERRTILATIGPVWDGNEVWLLAAGGTLYFAFPALYASGFSGFYLALNVVLWLLILRGISIEMRNHLDHGLWRTFWDSTFMLGSALLVIFFGTALGNVVRGVPLDEEGYFFLPLWTDLQPGAQPGILDWYTVSIGVAAFVALTLHGALWLVLKTEGAVQARAAGVARMAWMAMVPVSVGMTVASFSVQPHLAESFAARPWGVIFPALAIAGLVLIPWAAKRGSEVAGFGGSSLFLLGALCSAVFGLYPMVLPSNTDPARSLNIVNAAAPEYGLGVGFYWFIPALLLTLGYSFFLYRHFWGKVRLEPDPTGEY